MNPTPRAALLVGVAAASALVLPPALALAAFGAVVVAAVVDGFMLRGLPSVERTSPALASRGVPAELRLALTAPMPGPARLRQPAPPDVRIEPAEADNALEATLVARRRGRHVLPAPAVRITGPLGLARRFMRSGEDTELLVYPDLHAAFRLALSVRRSRFREAGRATRGPLGLGTEFESVREYLPDDDIRQVNWKATARLGRPMSNQYRVEQDRDVICLVDAGRLMAAPLADRTRLDAAVDAATAVAAVADELDDRCGAIAFDRAVTRLVQPRRSGGRAVIQALFDLEPTSIDSDYELAFRSIGTTKRALVIVLTDLLEQAAARPLVNAIPVLRRRHHVVVASVEDTDLTDLLRRPPQTEVDVYAATAAIDVLEARRRVTAQLRASGADVIEAPPDRLGVACVGAYLRAKARAQL